MAQDEDEAASWAAAHEKFVEQLDKIEGAFYKTSKSDSGNTFYTLMWEMEGETSKITIELRPVGHYANKSVFGIIVYATVIQSDSALPPAVIKAVATKSENTKLGHFSMTESFNTVYVNASLLSDNLTAGQIWMACAYVHQNRIGMKKEIDDLMAATKG
jgi:hypothetical protein